MIWERLLILLFVTVGSYLALRVWQQYLKTKTVAIAQHDLPQSLQALLQAGPNLLYFTGQYCAQCRLQQTPILAQLSAQNNIAIHTIDAAEEAGLAQFYGIMTVPTTVVLDEKWRPKAINHGLVTLPQLRQQLGFADILGSVINEQ